jgi:glycosyltransferase involved in cell wall biosynthesis
VRPLRVAVDARLRPGTAGGIENVVIGLAQGLSRASVDDVEVTFVGRAGEMAWLAPHLGDSLRVHEVSRASRLVPVLQGKLLSALGRSQALSVDTVMQALRSDVVHFPFQAAGLVSAPFVYHPHDLQHRHLPELFTAAQHADREARYPALCSAAAAVAVGSSWIKADIVEQLALPAEKVHVVPLAPVTTAPAAATDISGLQLPTAYAVYPAASWAHKNHSRLFAALAELRQRGRNIPLVLTGPRPPDGLDLGKLGHEHGVSDLVRDLGYLPLATAQAVIAGAVVMVVPTLFEAASFPIWEAFDLGVPVACSDVTSLPRQVGDAALLFDPRDVESVAKTLETLWGSPGLRAELAARGHDRVAEFTWEGTARTFLALYRRLGGRTMSAEDEHLLEREPRL